MAHTIDIWRSDLIAAIIRDAGALKRALSALRTSTLVNALH